MHRDIVEASPDGIWVVDLDGRTLYANRAMARQLGRTPAEMVGLSMYDVHDEVGRVQLGAHFAQLRAGRANPEAVECLLLRKDGSGTWVLMSESLLPADDDEPARVVLHVTDWTERRLLVQTLSRQQLALAEAERIARVGSWRYDVDTDLLLVSEGLCATLGLDPAAAPRTRDGFLALVHPDDVEGLDRVSAEAYEEGESWAAEVRIRTADGWRWFAGRGRASTDETGGVVHTGTFQDVQERREAQEALQDAALQNALMQATAAAANQAETFDEVLLMAQDLVVAHEDWDRGRAYLPDEHGRVAPYWLREEDRAEDEAQPELLAAERELAQRVHDARDVLWGEDPPGRHSIGFPVLHRGEVAAVLVIGEPEPFRRPHMIADMVRQAGVQIAHVVERERTAQELATARDAAEEGSRQKSDFLATMSHEIRTPLNGVIGLNDLLLRTDLDAEQHRLATGVQVSSRALLAIVDDVLDFSKIEAGHLALESVDFDVRAVFDQVAAVLGEAARARGLDLVVACHPEVPAALRGDPTRLAQVLTNLGSNAVKFTHEGRVLIEAGASPADDGSTLLEVEVVDTGVGIEPEQQRDVFQRFVQADASTTRRYGGTGLGLAICREIVHALGGEIGVESTPGEGSRFWFTARLAAAEGGEAALADRRARERLAGRRVLVVDDDEHNRLILTEQVGWWGMRCAATSSVEEALARLDAARAEDDPFALVLLDFAMPDRDGFDLARAVRARRELDDLPLVLLSSALPPSRARLQEAGIAAAVSKPVLTSALRSLVLHHVAGDRPAGHTAAAVTHARPVLVVEDNPVNQMVATGLLEALGHDAETADDGLAAVHAVRRALQPGEGGGYAAVLMDLQMPRLDGYEATRAIRELEAEHGGSRVPIIAMTASALVGERDRCLEAGMDDFLTKPVDPRALGDVVERWTAAAGEPGLGAAVPDPVGPEAGTGEPAPGERHASAGGDGDAVDGDLVDGDVVDEERLAMLRDLTEDHAYLDRVIGRFAAGSADLVASARRAVEAGDAEALRHAAHSLKGSATNLGLVSLGEAAFAVEDCGAAGDLARAADLLPGLAAAVERGRARLAAYRTTWAR